MNKARKLTQRVIERLHPASKPYWIRDTQIPEFNLTVTPTGLRQFNLDYRHRPSSSNRRWKVGDARWMTAQAAREIAYELKPILMAEKYLVFAVPSLKRYPVVIS